MKTFIDQPLAARPIAVAKRLLVLALLLGLAACSSLRVDTDYDTSRDFNGLRTYGWLTLPQPGGDAEVIDPLVDNDLMNRRVQRAVEAALAGRGYHKIAGDQAADFYVTYHLKAEQKLSVDSFHNHYGYYPCWGGCFRHGYGYGHGYNGYGYGAGYGPGFGLSHDISVRSYTQGTFMLDVVDPASRELMWRGVAGRRLNTGTPQERDQYVNEIITAIVAQFPPAALGTRVNAVEMGNQLTAVQK